MSLYDLLDLPVHKLIQIAVGRSNDECGVYEGAARVSLKFPQLPNDPLLPRDVQTLNGPELDVLHPASNKLRRATGSKVDVKNLGLVTLAARLELVVGPVIEGYAVVVVVPNGNQGRSVVRKCKPAMSEG